MSPVSNRKRNHHRFRKREAKRKPWTHRVILAITAILNHVEKSRHRLEYFYRGWDSADSVIPALAFGLLGQKLLEVSAFSPMVRRNEWRRTHVNRFFPSFIGIVP
jgi:hypothetical protein